MEDDFRFREFRGYSLGLGLKCHTVHDSGVSGYSLRFGEFGVEGGAGVKDLTSEGSSCFRVLHMRGVMLFRTTKLTSFGLKLPGSLGHMSLENIKL